MKSILVLLGAALLPLVPGAAIAQQVEVRLTVPQIRVRVAPPPVRVEVRPERQYADQIWIEGHWARRGSSNVWISGVWARPPQEGMVWEPARWDRRGGAYYYTEGHWRWADPTQWGTVYERPRIEQQVVVEHAPPRTIAERRPPRPFRGAVWINGYWNWDGGQHFWVAGRWSAPQQRAVWTPDRWKRSRGGGHGQQARWVLEPGHWERRR